MSFALSGPVHRAGARFRPAASNSLLRKPPAQTAAPRGAVLAAITTLAAMLVPATRAAAQVPATVDALVGQLATKAHLSGKKDQPENFDVFRLGWSLWDTNELAAGYQGAIAELVKSATAAGPSMSQHYLDVDAMVPCSLPYLDAGGAIHPQMKAFYDVVMNSSFSRFDMPGDLAPALGTPGINLLAIQDTVFSPVRDPATGVVTTWTYPGLAGLVAQLPPATAWPGMRLIQNIGFANNPGFPVGDYDYAFEHPLLTKPGTPEPVSGTDALAVYVQSDIVDDKLDGSGNVIDPGVITKLFYYLPLSMLHPDVAALLAQSIRERVTATPDGYASSFSVGGEFSFAVPIKAAWPVGCTPVDTPCDQPPGASAVDTYYCHLPDSDYSVYSLDHFRSWLQDRYGTLAALRTAWNAAIPAVCTSIVACPKVSPLAAVAYQPLGAGPVSWSTILADWNEFQAAQLSAARVFQYVAAKQERPLQSMRLYESDPRGADEAAQLSDGVSLSTFLPPTTPLGELPSRLKKVALHGASYGEPADFPLFGMKQDLAAGFSGGSADWPTAFLPATFHENHARRMLGEFLTLGVNAVGLAYFEAIGNWNIKDGVFTHDCPALPGKQDLNMAQCLGAEVDALQDPLAFMTPWRSPLLIHTGSWAGKLTNADIYDSYTAAPISSLMTVLADEQVQFAPFTRDDGFDDLWLPSTRQVLLVPFLPELDKPRLRDYQDFAASHQMHLLLLIDAAKEAALSMPVCYTLSSPGADYHVAFTPVPFQADCLTPLVHAAIVYHGTAKDASYEMLRASIQLADVLVTRPLRPVRAESSPGVLAHGVDVTVATDGLNLLACATNTRPKPQSFTLVPAVPGFTYSIPDGATPAAPLAQSESMLRYLKADLPPNAIPSLATSLDAAVGQAGARLTNLASVAPIFDTAAAEQLLLRLRNLSTQTEPEKVLAGLVRLQRMPFLRVEGKPGNTVLVSVVALDRTPIGGAPVQLEFVLQRHARRNGVTSRGNGPNDPGVGKVLLSIAQPADTIWDFTIPGKSVPAGNLVEVQVQHPQSFSQSKLLFVP